MSTGATMPEAINGEATANATRRKRSATSGRRLRVSRPGNPQERERRAAPRKERIRARARSGKRRTDELLGAKARKEQCKHAVEDGERLRDAQLVVGEARGEIAWGMVLRTRSTHS